MENENSYSRYRKKRFLSERKENNESNSFEDVNQEFSNLSLYKKRKVSQNEYILTNICYKIPNLQESKEENKVIDMEMEKKMVESHYNKINKFLCNIMFEN